MRQESTICNVTNKWLAFFILKPNLNQLTEAGGDQSHERLRAAAYGTAIKPTSLPRMLDIDVPSR